MGTLRNLHRRHSDLFPFLYWIVDPVFLEQRPPRTAGTTLEPERRGDATATDRRAARPRARSTRRGLLPAGERLVLVLLGSPP